MLSSSACLCCRNPQLAQEQLTTYCRDQYKRFFQLVTGLDSRENCGWCMEAVKKQLLGRIIVIKFGYNNPCDFDNIVTYDVSLFPKCCTCQNGNFDRENGDKSVQ